MTFPAGASSTSSAVTGGRAFFFSCASLTVTRNAAPRTSRRNMQRNMGCASRSSTTHCHGERADDRREMQERMLFLVAALGDFVEHEAVQVMHVKQARVT